MRAFALVILSILAAASSAQSAQRFEYSEVAMGVRARIVLYAPTQTAAEKAARAAYDRIAYLEQIMSDYRPDSELNLLCAKAGGEPVKVSPELLFILSKSSELARRSDGAFDPTVGPVVRLWRKARKSGVLPTPQEIEAAKYLVGWHKMRIDARASTVRLETPGMQLDLGGIAKGYACDEAQRVLKGQGIACALVEMGGDIVVSGAPPGKNGWEIAVPNIQHPTSNVQHSTPNVQRPGTTVHRTPFTVHGSGVATAVLADCAVSSSGDTEQFVEIGGARYSHIVNPKNGLGLTDRIAVTIIAPNGTTSDGLSTAVSVLGAKCGRTLASAFPDVSVYIRTARD